MDGSRVLQESNLAVYSHAVRHITSYRKQRVKDLPKVPMWRPVWDSKPWTFCTKGIKPHDDYKKGHQNFREIKCKICGENPKKVVQEFFRQMSSDEFFLKHALHHVCSVYTITCTCPSWPRRSGHSCHALKHTTRHKSYCIRSKQKRHS